MPSSIQISRGLLLAVGSLLMSGAATAQGGVTDVEGVRLGHATMAGRPTGCTVLLVETGAVGAVDVRGAAPGTRETDLLDPINTVSEVHAVVLTGGSAFGLDAATGVVRYLEGRGVGFQTGVGPVPIVPAAVLFDLGVGGDPRIRPDADCGFRAASSATSTDLARGNVGAGAGATVGKLRSPTSEPTTPMKGGLGQASIRRADGLKVAAVMAVNAVGDVVDPATGAILAGALSPDRGSFADARRGLLEVGDAAGSFGENTTIGVVVTNARLSKATARRVAVVAHDGMARAVRPAHTPSDGDVIFVLATGEMEADLTSVGEMAAEVVARAIVDAVLSADSLPGYLAARDLDFPAP